LTGNFQGNPLRHLRLQAYDEKALDFASRERLTLMALTNKMVIALHK